MKQYHAWLIGDVGIILASLFFGLGVFFYSAIIVPMIIAIPLAVIAFLIVDALLGRWYYNGVSIEDKFHRGGDDL